MQSVLEVVLEALVSRLQLQRCFIAVVDESQRLRVLAQHNLALTGNPAEWPVSRTIVARVLQDGVALISADAAQDKQLARIRSIGIHHIRSVICALLGLQGATLGVIYADHCEQTDCFTAQDLLLLTALSHYVYLGIRNAGRLARAVAEQQLSEERWTAQQEQALRAHRLVGKSAALRAAYDRLQRVAGRDLPLLILGETGSGKELFAQAAHDLHEKRAAKFFSACSIVALQENLIESELFGHERGAFTGAIKTRRGKFELAHGGTLFLDEVAEIPLHIQAKLLRVLETGDFERVGGTATLHSDVRLVCATGCNLEEAVRQGRFRKDLYYRLNGVEIRVPPLRERAEDIPDLVQHTLARLGSPKVFAAAALRVLQSYPWPGNIRQLIRVVEGVEALCDAPEIGANDLPDYLRSGAPVLGETFLPLDELIKEVERKHFAQALKLARDNNNRAIELLGVSREKFYDRKKAYGL